MGFVLTVCHVLSVFVVPLPIVISFTTSAASHYLRPPRVSDRYGVNML